MAPWLTTVSRVCSVARCYCAYPGPGCQPPTSPCQLLLLLGPNQPAAATPTGLQHAPPSCQVPATTAAAAQHTQGLAATITLQHRPPMAQACHQPCRACALSSLQHEISKGDQSSTPGHCKHTSGHLTSHILWGWLGVRGAKQWCASPECASPTS